MNNAFLKNILLLDNFQYHVEPPKIMLIKTKSEEEKKESDFIKAYIQRNMDSDMS